MLFRLGFGIVPGWEQELSWSLQVSWITVLEHSSPCTAPETVMK